VNRIGATFQPVPAGTSSSTLMFSSLKCKKNSGDRSKLRLKARRNLRRTFPGPILTDQTYADTLSGSLHCVLTCRSHFVQNDKGFLKAIWEPGLSVSSASASVGSTRIAPPAPADTWAARAMNCHGHAAGCKTSAKSRGSVYLVQQLGEKTGPPWSQSGPLINSEDRFRSASDFRPCPITSLRDVALIGAQGPRGIPEFRAPLSD